METFGKVRRVGKFPACVVSLGGLVGLLLAGAAEAQSSCGTTSLGTYWWAASGQVTRANSCLVPTGFRCYPAENTGYTVEKISPSCDPSAGSCAVKIHATATIPGVRDMIIEDGLFGSLTPWAEWYPCTGAGCSPDIVCGLDAAGGRINFDNLDTWFERGLSCGQAAATNLSVKIRVCAGSSCENAGNNRVIDIPAVGLGLSLGCPLPTPETCNEPGGGASGAAGASCPYCRKTAGDAGCSTSLSGQLACFPQGSGGGAFLRYTSGGPGNAGLPGSTGSNPWQNVLGKSWSHDHAERIVIDNATEGVDHVWMVTMFGSFREFKNLATGTGLRLYQSHAPSDEYRQLFYDTASGSWQLKGLDGSVEFFRSDGRWSQTTVPSDLSHPTFATYDSNGQLSRVTFPDGRSEDYTYYTVGGKLKTITENMVGGAAARTWTYTWSGDHLAAIQRPDGTAWELTYGTNGAPADGLSQLRLIGTDGVTGRVMAAFNYDAAGRVKDSWRGDPSFTGPNAVDKQSFTYTGSPIITQTVVSQVVSASYISTTTYTLGRDTVSSKGKILSMTGNCPTCGLAPNTTFQYNNAATPLLPSAMVDGRSLRTEYTYDANGRTRTRKENVVSGTPQRTTTYIYDTVFPGLVKEIDQPSTTTGQMRQTLMTYNATTSTMTSRTIQGWEAGASFTYPTGMTYNGAGQPLTIDPPGYTNQDVTTFTYNVPGTNGYLPDKRTDPLIGDTTFGYDGLNRRTSVTDVNNVQRITAYDALNRVTSVTRKGDPASSIADLVTTYFYDCPAGAPVGTCGPFLDLRCTQLPRGNGIAYVYDGAGRLVEIDRKADCNPASPVLERTAYTLDSAGNRILEERKRDNGGTEVSDSKTEYLYTCHLDKMTQGKGSATESVTEYCYDEDENLKNVWDANHPRGNIASPNPATQTYTFDNLNRLTQVSQPWTTGTADTKYDYDIQDHLSQVTDAEGNVTTYTTSDRDLQTRQVSPVSGTTNYGYNEHGQLTSQVDARTITTTRSPDALDRVTLVHTSDGLTSDVVYTYDAPCAFGKGRLCSINNGTAVPYAYDRFGRMIQDGSLGYLYDANSNRSQITYPGNVITTYGYDFADRQNSLSYNAGAGSLPVVTSAKYLSSGPLTQLVLANGLTEQHLFDARYFPSAVSVSGPTTLNWTYSVDSVGNITQISDGSAPRTYSYVDNLYFLKQGDGPWGPRSWTYDRIGNRLSEMRGATTDTYSYTSHNPRLTSIAMGGGAGTQAFSYDSAGNEIRLASPLNLLYQRYDGANRLVQFKDDATGAATFMSYDGRNFLTQARQDITTCCSPVLTQSVYSSEGLLRGRSVKNVLGGTLSMETKVFYFAGRPVGLLEMTTSPATVGYLSVDHLGAPILETSSAGASLWGGGFEPFGRDWNGAQAAGQFLRFPGQWDDAAWAVAGIGLYYNLNRWYESLTGIYTTPEPVRWMQYSTNFLYAQSRPTVFSDQGGLAPCSAISRPSPGSCCKSGNAPLGPVFQHVFMRRSLYCMNKDKPAITAEQKDKRGWIDVPAKGLPTAHYEAQGNPCVDWCICAHENFHIDQFMRGDLGLLGHNAAECEAYTVHLKCLGDITSGESLVTGN